MNSADKRKSTVMKLYDVDNVAKLPEVQAKRSKTFATKRKTLMMYQPIRPNILNSSELLVFRIDVSVADDWLNRYHPLGSPRGNLLCLGLVKGNTIYSMMTFKKSRNPQYVAELSRMWTLPTYYIVNGYDTLSRVATEFGIYNIIAYVHRSFERVEDYKRLGMRHVRDIQRTKWWIKDKNKLTDASRRQKRISTDELLKDGWYPVYDCGQAVYVFD